MMMCIQLLFYFIFQSKARIEESIKRVAKKKYKEDPSAGEKFVIDSMGLLSIATSADEALKTADLVVEAVRTKSNDLG